MKIHGLVLIVVLVFAAFGFFLWTRRDVMTVPAAPGADVSILIDNSSSQSRECAQIEALATAAISDLRIGRGSTLSLYTLGSPATAYEPVRRATIALQKSMGEKKKARNKIRQACGAIETVEGSSIYRAIQLILVQMQGEHKSGSRLYVQSDGEENVDHRLFQKHDKSRLLNNAGITTEICGFAVTAERGGPRGAHADSLIRTWQAAFVEPKQVTFRPFCEGQGTQQAAR